jgi:hypothetical protein
MFDTLGPYDLGTLDSTVDEILFHCVYDLWQTG